MQGNGEKDAKARETRFATSHEPHARTKRDAFGKRMQAQAERNSKPAKGLYPTSARRMIVLMAVFSAEVMLMKVEHVEHQQGDHQSQNKPEGSRIGGLVARNNR